VNGVSDIKDLLPSWVLDEAYPAENLELCIKLHS